MRNREYRIRRIWRKWRVCLYRITVSITRAFQHLVYTILCVCSDNCKIGLYCDTNSTTCIQQRDVGASCGADKECVSFNCLPNQVCGVSPSNPRHFATWVYAIIGIGIFGGKSWPVHFSSVPHNTHNVILGMIGTLVVLFFVHRRQRDDEREKRLQYWREQVKKNFSSPSHRRAPDSPIFTPVERFPPKHPPNARNSPVVYIPQSGFIPPFGSIWRHNGGLSDPNVTV